MMWQRLEVAEVFPSLKSTADSEHGDCYAYIGAGRKKAKPIRARAGK